MELKVKQCVGCGYCCISSACDLELKVYGNSQDQCPSLYWDNKKNRYMCHFVTDKHELINWLHIGTGCCSGLNSWRLNVQKRRACDE
jgi:hypothetical protein